MAKVSLRRYKVVFGLSLIAFMVAVALINAFIREGSAVGIMAVLPFLAAIVTGNYFLEHEKMLPSTLEKRRLIRDGLIIFVFLNLMPLAFLFLVVTEQVGRIGAKITIMLAVPISLIVFLNYFLMRWAYGGLLQKRAKKLGINPVSVANTFD